MTKKLGIPVKVILDSSVAVVMPSVDFVLVGAEGVTESGGIINRIGTYGIGILAKAMNTPFYVVAESHKFNRIYPLTQNDIPWKDKIHSSDSEEIEGKMSPKSKARNEEASKAKISSGGLLEIEYDRVRDYTPPEYITLLFTGLHP